MLLIVAGCGAKVEHPLAKDGVLELRGGIVAESGQNPNEGGQKRTI